MEYGQLSLDQIRELVQKIGGMEAVRRVLNDELLGLVGEPLQVSETVHFVARERLVINAGGIVPISYLGENIKNHFIELVETDVEAVTLRQRKLFSRAVDGPIIDALGGEERARVAFAQAFEFLKSADRSGYYIFYVADSRGVLWAVHAFWYGIGWDLEATRLTLPLKWLSVYHVVSR